MLAGGAGASPPNNERVAERSVYTDGEGGDVEGAYAVSSPSSGSESKSGVPIGSIMLTETFWFAASV